MHNDEAKVIEAEFRTTSHLLQCSTFVGLLVSSLLPELHRTDICQQIDKLGSRQSILKPHTLIFKGQLLGLTPYARERYYAEYKTNHCVSS